MRVDPISKTASDVPCDFSAKYDDYCRQYHLLPLSSVKIKLDSGIIDLDTDTLRFDDWTPLCSAIGTCKTLRSLTLRSQYYNSSSNNFAEAERRTLKRASSASKRPPIFQSKELLSKICTHIKDSLLITTELVLLELDGLPFRRKDLTILAQGIAKCKSLIHFRLTNSSIGDEGLDILCRHLNQAPKIREVDFSACSLTSQGAHIIADLIRQQGNRRHTDVWKESLRHQQKESLPYQNPMLDHMSGLRRVTLNRNPLIADRGATFLAEVIEADLWIKALDLQDCAISTNGAKEFLNAANYNSLIHIIDIRNNPLVDRDIMEKLIEQLLVNCEDDRLCEYKWLKLESPRRPRSKIARTATTTAGANQPVHFHPRTPIDPTKLQRSKSTGSVSTEPRSDGIPWRTAARAARLPGFPPRLPTRAFHSSEESIYGAGGGGGGGVGGGEFQQQQMKENSNSRIQRLENKLREERQAKKQLEEQLQQILAKNDLAQRQQDHFCAVVENTFQKFQKFLDFLRSKRLGELITMAGLDDAFTNPLDELRETSLSIANGSNTNHQSVIAEKSEERSQSSSSSSETTTKHES
ncbi:unnamed protein product [Adineta steineri]|uniref:Centrosomal protein of 78 kDa n=1 Tax=Adineta steineri TaxID=433720 RepID=A0A813TAX5_9BILA|nr:unnamed protein product [Adineta steineri]CAF1363514.1 unnamed protein product [Adineta steineri]CAF3549739.1 unnamed protein product [Adineta steineri]CAF3574368.1 unnamed protein product [Adineta steineri]